MLLIDDMRRRERLITAGPIGLAPVLTDEEVAATVEKVEELHVSETVESRQRPRYTWLDKLIFQKGLSQECTLVNGGAVGKSSELKLNLHGMESQSQHEFGHHNSNPIVGGNVGPLLPTCQGGIGTDGHKILESGVILSSFTSISRLPSAESCTNSSLYHATLTDTDIPHLCHRNLEKGSGYTNGQITSKVAPGSKTMTGGFILDLFGMEDRQLVLFGSRQKVGRKGQKPCFLKGAAAQRLAEETKYSWYNGHSDRSDPEKERHPPGKDSACPIVLTDEDKTLDPDPLPQNRKNLLGVQSAGRRRRKLERGACVSISPQKGRGTFERLPKKIKGTRKRQNPDTSHLQVAGQARKKHKVTDSGTSSHPSFHQSSCAVKGFNIERNGGVPEPGLGKGPSTQKTLVSELASDHPGRKPQDSLVNITYHVFLQAGKGGLTARQAASHIESRGLTGLFQGLSKPRIKIGKIIRNNPYYLNMGDGKYILCEAIVGVTQPVGNPQPHLQEEETAATKTKEQEKPSLTPLEARKEAAAVARRIGTARYWARVRANSTKKEQHKKLGAGLHKEADANPMDVRGLLRDNHIDGHPQSQVELQKNVEGRVGVTSKPRLKGMVRESCEWTDGKNWQCPLLAPLGSIFCIQHQQRMK